MRSVDSLAGSRESRADGVRMGTNDADDDVATADANATAAGATLSGGGSLQLLAANDDDDGEIDRFRL